MQTNQRVGPKVHVRVEYECNGCQFLSCEKDSNSEDVFHACNHPAVLEEYTVPQWLHSKAGSPHLSIHYPAKTPTFCPYLKGEQ